MADIHLHIEFLVDGKHFPQVPYDIGESYSGLLSNTPHGNSSLFFWFFPSINPDAKKEVWDGANIVE
jgi:carboxypeptidase D